MSEGLVEESADLGGLGDVGLDGDGACAQGAELGDYAFGGRGGFAVVDNHVGAS